jgi:hypothetical protein
MEKPRTERRFLGKFKKKLAWDFFLKPDELSGLGIFSGKNFTVLSAFPPYSGGNK